MIDNSDLFSINKTLHTVLHMSNKYPEPCSIQFFFHVVVDDDDVVFYIINLISPNK